MAENDIFRSRTESESKLKEGGFLDVRYWRADDVKQQQLKKIADIEHNALYKLRKPFCTKCAVNAIDSRLTEINKEIDKAVNKGATEIKIDFNIDYTQFIGDKCFDFIEDTEVLENKLIDGMKQKVQTGIYKNFMCRDCGFHISMEFKMKEIETNALKIDPKLVKG